MNVPINDNDNDNVNDNDHILDKLFVNKPSAIGYNVVKKTDYENLNWQKDGYIKYFGEDCVKWSINEMLETQGYMKNYFEIEFEVILIQVRKILIKVLVCYVKKNLNLKM